MTPIGTAKISAVRDGRALVLDDVLELWLAAIEAAMTAVTLCARSSAGKR